MKKRNEIGNVYGMLTVLREAEKTGRLRRVLCRCECGTEKPITLLNLRSGNTKSCGCKERSDKGHRKRPKPDKIGNVYGRLTVIREVEGVKTKTSISRRFECLCECGNTKVVYLSALLSGKTKSCGCLNRESAVIDDLTGRVFDYLTVIERSYERSYRDRAFWLCKCKCGNTRVADSAILKRGQITECSDDCVYFVSKKDKCSIYAYSQRRYHREYYHHKRKAKKSPPTR